MVHQSGEYSNVVEGPFEREPTPDGNYRVFSRPKEPYYTQFVVTATEVCFYFNAGRKAKISVNGEPHRFKVKAGGWVTIPNPTDGPMTVRIY